MIPQDAFLQDNISLDAISQDSALVNAILKDALQDATSKLFRKSLVSHNATLRRRSGHL